MTPAAYCEDLVRRSDYDRYMAVVFAPAAARAPLFALYAFNFEIARIAESVSQPVAGQIRLQWWRETVEGLYRGSVCQHPIAVALAQAARAHDLPRALFDEMIEARESDLEAFPFADLAAMEAYADTTSGHVMRLAARILGAAGMIDESARHAGIAYALAGLLRALSFQAARSRMVLPRDLLAAGGLTGDDAFTTANGMLTPIVEAVATCARHHLERIGRVPRRFLPALLPATLVPLYLRAVARQSSNPLRESAKVPRFRRQFAALASAIRGSVAL